MIKYTIDKNRDEWRVSTECNINFHAEEIESNCDFIYTMVKTMANHGCKINETYLWLNNDRVEFLSIYSTYPTEEQIIEKHAKDIQVLSGKIKNLLPLFEVIGAYHKAITKQDDTTSRAATIERMSLKPSDILVYKTRKELSCDAYCRITSKLTKVLREQGLNNRVIILEAGEELVAMTLNDVKEKESINN